MASLLFSTIINTDLKLIEQRRAVFASAQLPRWGFDSFDTIVLDKFQDCTHDIFWLINCFIMANERLLGRPARIVVLGDERQSIHDFRGADKRFLTLAPELLGPINASPFLKMPLNESFRLSKQCVRFINDVFLAGETYITSSKGGPKPVVLKCNVYDTESMAEMLLPFINEYGPENSAIIAPSIRQPEGPLQKLTNRLSSTFHVPIAVSINEDAPLDDRVISGKLCVSTIHQFKGSERDLTILFGLDNSYFQFYGRDLPDHRCPNEAFVALTRAKKQLILIHNARQRHMPFVSVEALHKTAVVIDMTKSGAHIALPDPPKRTPVTGLAMPDLRVIAVRDLVRHIRDQDLDRVINDNLLVEKVSEPLPER